MDFKAFQHKVSRCTPIAEYYDDRYEQSHIGNKWKGRIDWDLPEGTYFPVLTGYASTGMGPSIDFVEFELHGHPLRKSNKNAILGIGRGTVTGLNFIYNAVDSLIDTDGPIKCCFKRNNSRVDITEYVDKLVLYWDFYPANLQNS